jgi:hypothetical protein
MERALAAFADWDDAALAARRRAIVDWAMRRWHVDGPAANDGEDLTTHDEG